MFSIVAFANEPSSIVGQARCVLNQAAYEWSHSSAVTAAAGGGNQTNVPPVGCTPHHSVGGITETSVYLPHHLPRSGPKTKVRLIVRSRSRLAEQTTTSIPQSSPQHCDPLAKVRLLPTKSFESPPHESSGCSTLLLSLFFANTEPNQKASRSTRFP
jgi:hypothetical protein